MPPPFPSSIPYLICGAGPAGCCLHASLLTEGVPPSSIIHVEKRTKPPPRAWSRALLVHARTLEAVEECLDDKSLPKVEGKRFRKREGFIDPEIEIPERIQSTSQVILEYGHHLRRTSFKSSSTSNPAYCHDLVNLTEKDFDILPTKFPYFHIISQTIIEEILRNRISTLGGQLSRGWKVIDLRQGEEGQSSEVIIENVETKEIITVKAGIVVGADGGNSIVRQKAGIDFVGGVYAPTFLLADLKMKDPEWPWKHPSSALIEDSLNVIFSTVGYTFWIPMAEGCYRFNAAINASEEDFKEAKRIEEEEQQGGNIMDSEAPGLEEVQKLLDMKEPRKDSVQGEVLGRDGIKLTEIAEMSWSSRFRIQHRIAASFRSHSTLLIGDSGHVHSVSGGQGMNTGMQDGMSLGKVLADDYLRRFSSSSSVSSVPLDNFISPSLNENLNLWVDHRHKIATKVVGMTDFLTKTATMESRPGAWFRDRFLEWVIGVVPPMRNTMAFDLAELGNPLFPKELEERLGLNVQTSRRF